MKTKAENVNNNFEDEAEVIDDNGEDNTEQVGTEQQSSADQDNQAEDDQDDSDEDDVIVSIGEEAPPQEEQTHAPAWVKELRKTSREKDKRIRELESRLSTTTTETKPVLLGAKPKLEDHDYDSEKYEDALSDWFDRKRNVDTQIEKSRSAEQAQQRAWQEKLDGYGKAKAELKVRDYEDAEAVAQELFNLTQQGIVLQGADNPALVIYALGKNPKKAAELAKLEDPVKFAFAVAKLEKELKVTNRKAAPAPERMITSTGRSSGAVDSTLERLRAEAEKTGNMTKVVQYKAQKRAASK
jgi:hypothetical protein